MRHPFFLTLVLGIFLMGQSLFHYALDPQKKITQYMHDSWGIEQGLPQNSVHTIIQTADGYLWMGTLEGLVRFDGVRFKVFGKTNGEQLPDNTVYALEEDRAGNLWIGTYSGGITSLKQGKFTRYTHPDDKGLSQSRIRCIHEDRQGNLWVGTDTRGVYCLKDGNIISITVKDGLSDNKIWSIYENRQGNLWIGTESGGVNRLKNGTLTTYTTREGLSHNCVWSLYEDYSGNLWIGTNGGGLNRLKDGKFTVYTTKDGLSSNRIKALHQDRDGNLWIGTYLGLNRLKDGKFSTYASHQKEAHLLIYAIYEDREGSLWIGTEAGGLFRLKDGKFTPFSTREGLADNRVRAVYEDRAGNLWLGTFKGVNRLKNETLTVYSTKDGLSDNIVQSICQDRDGILWLGTFHGLNRMDPKTGEITLYKMKEGWSDHNIYVVYEDRQGSLWIGAQKGGLIRLKDGELSHFTKEQGLGSDEVRCIYQDSVGDLWIGTDGGGLNRLNPSNEKLDLYTTKDGLSSNIMAAIYEDREGTLWIGTFGGGLNRLKDGKFSSITTKDGLFNDVVYCILEDESGYLWMSCNKGIFRVNKKEVNDFIDRKNKTSSLIHCISYDEKDGMRSRECIGGTYPAAWKTRDGILWFSTIKGAVKIDPNNIKINWQPPPVVIEAIIADNRTIQPPFSRYHSKQEQLHLPAGSHQVDIHYTAPSLLSPDRMKFRYQLEGYDKEWRSVGTRRIAYYTGIPPGDYTFRVIACNDDGIWNEAGAAVSFYLEPYFYQTWWFYMICAFSTLFLALGIYRFRVRQITNRKIELERLVDERTRQLEESSKELEKLSIVARETHNAVTVMDAKGNLEWINEGAIRMYGYTLEQLFKEKGRNIIEISSNPNIRQLFAEFSTKRESLRYETLYKTRDGKKIWTQSTWTPILDHNGNLIKIVAIGSDVTKLKQSKDQINKQNKEIRKQNQRILEQAERLKEAIKIAQEEREAANAANKAKSEFLARMSHEIRTPMNSVIGFSEMLMDTPLNEEQRDYASTISRSGEALITIIDDILDFSKIEAGMLTFEPIDFDPEVMVFDVCELTIPRLEDRPIEILCRVGDRVPAFVKQDPGRFRQVLINLMGNAAKFTEKGEIELSIDVAEKETDRLKLHIMVRDTGIGIPPGKLNSIFEVFQQVNGSVTRRFGGTGLGLAISKQIAKHMGGDIRVESTPGQGSTFHFYAWVERSKKTPAEKPVLTDLTGKRILIVDDNLSNLDILEHILKKNGLSVVKQTSSEKVIPVLQENLENGTPFDCCILDLMMPGLNGYEVAQQIRALDSPVSELPLLAFSSSSYRQAKKYREYGFDAFLPKPIRSQKLLRVLEQLLHPEKIARVRAEQERSELVTRHSAIENAKHAVRILLAEDNPVNRKLAVFLLTKAGYQVDVAVNGKEVVEKYISEPGKYDLIFMDIQMPELDGRKATRNIREKGFDRIPIIAMTAESMKGDEEKCLAAGMNDYISKPIRREIVFEMIKKWVLKKSTSIG